MNHNPYASSQSHAAHAISQQQQQDSVTTNSKRAQQNASYPSSSSSLFAPSSEPTPLETLTHQLQSVQQQLAAAQEENFDLQASLVAADAECQHHLKSAEQQHQRVLQKLQEQLRRSQQEVYRKNTALEKVKKGQNHQPQHQQNQQQAALRINPVPKVIETKVAVSPTKQQHEEPKEETASCTTNRLLLRSHPEPWTVQDLPILLLLANNKSNTSHSQVLSQLLEQQPSNVLWIHRVLQHAPAVLAREVLQKAVAEEGTEQHDSMDYSTASIVPTHQRTHRRRRKCTLRNPENGELVQLHNLHREQDNSLPQPHLVQGAWKRWCQQLVPSSTRSPETSIQAQKLFQLLIERADEDAASLSRLPSSTASIPWHELYDEYVKAAGHVLQTALPSVKQQFQIKQQLLGLRLLNPTETASSEEDSNTDDGKWYMMTKENNTVILDWLSQTLCTLTLFWKHSVNTNNSASLSFWTPYRTRSLTALGTDFLELIVLPHSTTTRIHSDLTHACIDWFQAQLLWHTPVVVLRAQMPTSLTTTKQWHRGHSAIGVCVKLFHQVVMVMQKNKDENDGDMQHSYSSIRDSLIRLFHGLHLLCHSTQSVCLTDLLCNELPEWFTSAATLSLTFCDNLDSHVQIMLREQLDQVKQEIHAKEEADNGS